MMKPIYQYSRFVFLAIVLFAFGIHSNAQSKYYDILPVNGNTSFSHLQTPENLVSLNSTITGYTFLWESSTMPLSGFSSTGQTTANYTFSPGSTLAQTTYFRRRARNAQNVDFYSNVIKINVVSVNWENLNYIREHDVLVSGQTDWKVIDQLAIGSKLQTTTYLDGLGRAVQKVSRESSLQDPALPNNLWGDVVQFSQFDVYGRADKQYLPYTTTTQSGKYKTTAETEQANYHVLKYNETAPYDKVTTYDNSPLNRPTKTNESGTNWTASAGSLVSYDLTDATDNVQNFSIGYNTTDLPVSLGIYPPKSLFKTKYTDENSKQVIEYRDLSGQLILTKKQLDDVPANAYTGWICTYNVYDDFRQLRFVMQPEAVKWLAANSWNFAAANGQTVANEWCFRYNYDDKGRTIVKKAPGAKELYMLYDSRDRVVFMQDGNQRLKSPPEWTANIYDELDRVVITTLYRTTKTATTPAGANLQTDIDNSLSSTTVSVTNAGSAITDLVLNNRQAGVLTYTARNSIEFVADADGNFESLTNDDFTAEINATATSPSVNVSETVYRNPITSTDLNNASVTTILKYFFYDDYTFASVKAFSTSFDNAQAYASSDPIAKTQRTTNMATGSMIRILGTSKFLNNTFYYDEKGRPIQASEDNVKDGVDITTYQYQFDGRLLSSATRHTTAGSGYSNFAVITKNIFDKIGRVNSIQKKIGAAAFKTIANYDFDDVGRLKTKHLSPGYANVTTGKNELEALNYSYNLHNQITGINRDYALKTSGVYNKWSNYFSFVLGFDKNEGGVFAATRKDGLVNGMVWNTQGDDAQRKYDFTYDNAGRLTKADFNERQNTTDAWAKVKMDFTVSGYNGKIEYDLNGNLLAMLQKGVVPGNNTPKTVDDLRYTYTAFSNKLAKVADLGNMATVNGKLGDFADGANGADDYVYDDNGNLIIDLNKSATNVSGGVATPIGTSGIKYNFLDKPEEITITGKGTIKIVYDADGNRLQKSYTKVSATTTTVTSYINEFIYEQTTSASGDGNLNMQYINFEEGRVRVMQSVAQNNGFDFLTIDGNMDLPGTATGGASLRGTWDFFVRDYQGNVRMILTEETHVGSNSCTMETNRAANEEPVFGQVDAAGVPTAANEVKARFAITGIPGQTSGGGWTNNTSAQVARLGNLAGKKVGPNTLLKVMAGDAISAQTIYYYQNPVVNSAAGPSFLSDVLNGIVQAISGSSAASSVLKGNATTVSTQLNADVPFKNIAEPDYNNATGNTPKAYLSVIFFDERFNVVTEGSISKRVLQAGANAAPLSVINQKAPKNGYCYIYVSNESDEMVYFDNLQVTNTHARIIEENHYYSYGLKIAALSSRKMPDVAEGSIQNQNQYQGDYSEFDEEMGWNDFQLRNYDPQIGRWIQIDPYDEFPSPYTGMGNNPISFADPTGGFLGLSVGASIAVSTLGGAIVGTAIDIISGGDGTAGLAIGAGAGLLGGLGANFGIGAIAGGVTKSVGTASELGNTPKISTANGTDPKPRIRIITIINENGNRLPEGTERPYWDTKKGNHKIKVGAEETQEGEDKGDIITYTDTYEGPTTYGGYNHTGRQTNIEKGTNRVPVKYTNKPSSPKKDNTNDDHKPGTNDGGGFNFFILPPDSNQPEGPPDCIKHPKEYYEFMEKARRIRKVE